MKFWLKIRKKIYREGSQTDTRAQRGCGNFTTGDSQNATGQGFKQSIWLDSHWAGGRITDLQRSLPTEVILLFYPKLLEDYKNSQRAQLFVCEKLQHYKSKKDNKINMVLLSSCRLGMLLQIHESPRGILLEPFCTFTLKASTFW